MGADVVITLTEARAPLVLPGTLKPGAVLCSMGSHNEVDYGVLLESQRLVVDDRDFAAEMGDGAAWISQGRLSRGQFEARIETFNLFNHVGPGVAQQINGFGAVGNPTTAFTNTLFGKITTAADPRIMQFAIKYLF